MTTAIIIPSFNPPEYFIHLIHSLRNETSMPIIIIDDGSEPKIQINNQYNDVILLRNKINKGKGYALIKGMNFIFEKGYTHAITLDADLQHDPTLILDFLSIDENISIVCGKRDLISPMPVHRRLSNIITSRIVSFICGIKLYDSQSGYRRYRLKDVCKVTFIEEGFQFETEVLIELSRKGLLISHIDIPTIYFSETSTMSNFYDTFKFIKLIIRSLRKL